MSKKTEIAFFSRKKTAGAFSIGQIFEIIAEAVAAYRPVAEHELPHPSNSIFNLLRNVDAARRNAGAGVNHITGDAHYVALGIGRGRVVLTIHDCILLMRTPPNRLKYYLYLWLWYKFPIWKADIITTISEKSKDEIIRFTGCPPDKIRVIPNCVNPAYRFERKPFNAQYPRILHIGVAPHKNLGRVAEALKGIPCVLEIIGQLNENQLDVLKKAGIHYENSVNLNLGMLAERYRAADMVVFASLYEGFGMPIIEAQASGRPVVTSNIEPMPWVAGVEGACFVDPTDVESIRNGIKKVISSKSYQETLIEKGLENVQRFSITRITELYTAVYENLYPAPRQRAEKLSIK